MKNNGDMHSTEILQSIQIIESRLSALLQGQPCAADIQLIETSRDLKLSAESEMVKETRIALLTSGLSPSCSQNQRILMDPFTRGKPTQAVIEAWLASRRAFLAALNALRTRNGNCVAALHFSLSHTASAAIAVITTGPLPIGVDLEPSDRPIGEAVIRRVSKPSELELGLRPIELWTAKEACFKSAPDNPNTLVSDYLILSRTTGSRTKPTPLKFEFSLLDVGFTLQQRFSVALAVSRHE